MNPVLLATASRLAPLLARMGSRFAGAGGFNTRASMIRFPEVDGITPMDGQGATPGAVAPPISTDNSGPMSPNERVAQGFNATGPSASQPAVLAGPNSPSPLDNASWPFGPKGAPVAASASSPLDTAQWPHGPVGAPQQSAATPSAPQEPMGFFARNSAMMRDPLSGAFIDPAAAQVANVSGPDLIQKFMNYFNQKGTA